MFPMCPTPLGRRWSRVTSCTLPGTGKPVRRLGTSGRRSGSIREPFGVREDWPRNGQASETGVSGSLVGTLPKFRMGTQPRPPLVPTAPTRPTTKFESPQAYAMVAALAAQRRAPSLPSWSPPPISTDHGHAESRFRTTVAPAMLYPERARNHLPAVCPGGISFHAGRPGS